MLGLTAQDLEIVLLSLRVAAVATLFALPLAFAVAWALARGRFWGRGLLDALVHLPLVLPPVATGYALLLLLGRQGLLGAPLSKLGIVLAFDWTGAALAAAVMAFPLMVRPIRLSIEAIDPQVDQAARTLGAGTWARLTRLTLPLALPGIAAGAVLGFAKALGEFGATITFAAAIPGVSLTLPSAIYQAIQTPGAEQRAAALCLVAALIAVTAVIGADALTRWALKRAGGA
ncbi:molybdate ABC transporter permease subunit [Caulobacter sp. NIBR1757]|uniref:molybdate ABC transporter permease subunit n=1 Tax=Caulobacter sp. NIBR1757 TaxID=3016000 RepID=UPI0022F0C46C|nr:molybdate ABC transporter permease subunit [Caulobacter sp. NIBR1757]WGM41256.1 Molybdenum transport system permease protein ModB [Caulobacter sp. NIBR1757]